MWKELRQREAGSLRPHSFSGRLFSARMFSLELSNRKDFVSPHLASINSLQVDSTECRYLLSGASDGSIAVFDTHCPSNYEGEGGIIANHRTLFSINKRNKDAHKFAVSSAIWYPIDTGLFITASFDRSVKVWDTNETQVVMEFRLPGKVYGMAMSGISTTHTLIAAANRDSLVRLCDITSGAFTHTLAGHRDGVMAVEWSNSNEFILTSGGFDGSIRFWDIRRAGSFLVLDHANSQIGRRSPLLNNTESSVSQNATSSNMKPKKGKYLNNSKNQNISLSQNRAIAHYGAVTGIRATPDGMYLLSSGSDSRLRLWDIESGRNTLVNYESVRLQNNKPIHFDISSDSSLVFIPCMNSIKVYDMWSGKLIRTFRGHYELVNCCYFDSNTQELYTGGNDRQILVWSPSFPSMTKLEEMDSRGRVVSIDQDNWSD